MVVRTKSKCSSRPKFQQGQASGTKPLDGNKLRIVFALSQVAGLTWQADLRCARRGVASLWLVDRRKSFMTLFGMDFTGSQERCKSVIERARGTLITGSCRMYSPQAPVFLEPYWPLQ